MGEQIKSAQRRVVRLVSAMLIGGGPVWMILLIGDFTDRTDGWQIFVRSNSLVVPFIEFSFVLFVMAVGVSPLQAFSKQSRLTKIAVMVWLTIVIITSFQQGNDYLSADIALIKLFCAALFLMALFELRRASDGNLFATIWFAVGCGMPLYILLWAVQIAITQPSGEEWMIQVPGVNNVRHVGYFAFAGFFAGVACLISFRDHASALWRWYIPIFFSSSALGLALWTGSRGPTLAMISGMVVVIILGPSFRRLLSIFLAAAALTAVVAVAALPVPHPAYGIWGATGMADPAANDLNSVSSGRIKLWTETIEKIQEKPDFGWGIEQFSTFGPKDTRGMRHPHNFPLQLLFSGGVVSILLVILMIFPTLRTWHPLRSEGIELVGTGCIAGILIYSMYDGALFFSYPIMIFLLAIATSISPPAKEPSTDRSG